MKKFYGLISIFVLFLYGCRNAPDQERSYNGTRATTNNVSQEPSRESRRRESRGVKRNHQVMTGSEIFKNYNNSVFMIFTSDGTNNYQGSGFFIGKNGLAVSNYHVFAGTSIGAENIKLSYDNQQYYKVSKVIYKSKEPDFIIFQVAYDNSDFIPIAQTKPNIGDKIYAIGSPRGLENTFSSGEVSQWRGDYLMQIDALIDHGSSGGALINEYGEAVGITSGSFYDGSQANLNYAWSIEAVKGHY